MIHGQPNYPALEFQETAIVCRQSIWKTVVIVGLWALVLMRERTIFPQETAAMNLIALKQKAWPNILRATLAA
jgi:hypothetical protein